GDPPAVAGGRAVRRGWQGQVVGRAGRLTSRSTGILSGYVAYVGHREERVKKRIARVGISSTHLGSWFGRALTCTGPDGRPVSDVLNGCPMKSIQWRARWPARPPAGVPTGITVALGSAAVVLAALVCAGATAPSAHTARLVVLTVVVAGVGRLSGDLLGAASTGGIAWLVLNRFLGDEPGRPSRRRPAHAAPRPLCVRA